MSKLERMIVAFAAVMLTMVIAVSLARKGNETNSEPTISITSNTETATTSVKTTQEETTTKATTTETETIKETETEITTETTTSTAIPTLGKPSIFDRTTTKKAKGDTFYYDDGEPLYISPEEYYVICGIVMNEAGAYYGSYEGRVAVAQCIRNQIIREKKCGHAYDIATIRRIYGEHTTKTPSDEVRQAVTDVFYNHVVVTKEPIIAWCASGYNGWHSNNATYVCSYGGNDFYKLYDSMYYY